MGGVQQILHIIFSKNVRRRVRYYRELIPKLISIYPKIVAGGRQTAHTMPGHLVVNITSYTPRFRTLSMTLKSVLRQSSLPDKVILWIAPLDIMNIPGNVLRLRDNSRFEIRVTDDLRSYKKLIPALRSLPNSFHVIADDDVYYPPTWLSELIETWKCADALSDNGVISFHRGHRVSMRSDTQCLPYHDWTKNIQFEESSSITTDVMPTGVGGVLYPPGSMHPDVTDSDLFMKIAPTTDDVWFYWMARRVGTVYAKTLRNFRVLEWPGTVEASLLQINAGKMGSGNDQQIANMIDLFGPPGGIRTGSNEQESKL